PGRPAPSRSPSPPPVTTPWPTASPSSTPSWLPSPTPRSTTASCPTLTLHDALPIYGQTALMMAVRNRNPELVKLLVSAGANAELVNNAGKSAKDLALEAIAGEGVPMQQVLNALGCESGVTGTP